jgi:hypothetical protein
MARSERHERTDDAGEWTILDTFPQPTHFVTNSVAVIPAFSYGALWNSYLPGTSKVWLYSYPSS